MLNKLLLFFLIILGAFSCKQPDKEPEFKHVQNIQVKKFTGEEVLLNAEAVFYNPNDMRMKLRGVDVDLYVEGKKVGNIEQDTNMPVLPMSEFTVPFDATFNLKEVGAMNTLLNVMLGGKKLMVRYDGFIKVTVNGLPFRVKVDYENEVRFR